MRYIETPATIRTEDFEAARGYLRYYQRGLVGFTVLVVLGLAAERLLPPAELPAPWLQWSRTTQAAAAVLYVVAPYRRKLTTLWKQVRPIFDLLSDRR
ncbi:hypothetical protein [Actinoplanes siamensis]|uniref:Uncharacterized protein n=1 Tax=Actinoplanes siamensis TaxID=1223317 RepID=A0A919NC50_9ACTN|nr:hypothetical protein [Actinoplanes siamensis]GIF08396.1 hypothetical protein Asi03nite_59340 [Actinoplanes siamensis]